MMFTSDTHHELSVVIVNWNSDEYSREAIVSLFKHARVASFEIILVDNASQSGDVDALSREFPSVRVIKCKTNIGFARANNLGARYASGRNVLFLNPDTKVLEPGLQAMVHALETLPRAAIAGCKLLNADMSIQTSCIQRFPTVLNQFFDSDMLRNRWPSSPLWGTAALENTRCEPTPVEVVSGACLMIDRLVFEHVGGVGEEYFMYAEDLDLCYKIRRAGYRAYYVPEAEVIHYGGKSSSPRSATVMKWRSILQYCVKTRGPLYALAFRAAMIVAAIVRLSILTIVHLFESNNNQEFSPFVKWKAILKTLLSPLPGLPQQTT
jgi:hypothetical protein